MSSLCVNWSVQGLWMWSRWSWRAPKRQSGRAAFYCRWTHSCTLLLLFFFSVETQNLQNSEFRKQNQNLFSGKEKLQFCCRRKASFRTLCSSEEVTPRLVFHSRRTCLSSFRETPPSAVRAAAPGEQRENTPAQVLSTNRQIQCRWLRVGRGQLKVDPGIRSCVSGTSFTG